MQVLALALRKDKILLQPREPGDEALQKDKILLQPREPGDEAMLAHVSTVSGQTTTADQTQCTCRQINMSTQ